MMSGNRALRSARDAVDAHHVWELYPAETQQHQGIVRKPRQFARLSSGGGVVDGEACPPQSIAYSVGEGMVIFDKQDAHLGQLSKQGVG